MALVLGVGVAIVTVTMLGAVSSRRRDFGRRRALGASRSSLITLVLIHTAVAAVTGLCVLVALLGALIPALAAAYRDPMRILRVP